MAARDLERACLAYTAVLEVEPAHPMAHLRLSTLATTRGRYRESVGYLTRLASLQPSDPFLLVLLAGMLHRLGEVRTAVELIASPEVAASGDADLIEQCAQLALQLEQLALAESLLGRLQGIDANRVGAFYARGTLRTFEGSLDEADALFNSALRVDPAHAQSHWAISGLRRATPQHNHVDRLQFQIGSANARASVFLHFALFKELDELDRCDEAWDALSTACRLKRSHLKEDPGSEARVFELLQSIGSDATLLDATKNPAGPVPIFIVGMPRTGTTLLERVLGNSDEVINAGELDDFPLQMRWLADRFSKSYMDPAIIDAVIHGGDLALLGTRYLDHARWRAGGKPFFTDKLPMNFLHVGLIARSLPQARILHMVRGPMDTCFSNLKELFTETYPYSYDQAELAAHYARYRRLMAHWHAQFPGRILDVSYEGLVAEPERVARQVFDFCGLQWREGSSRIESLGTAVSTASSVQVRQPIHARNVDAWRRYERQLAPLSTALREAGWVAP